MIWFLFTCFVESDLITSSVLDCGVKIVHFENKTGLEGGSRLMLSACSMMCPTQHILTTGMVAIVYLQTSFNNFIVKAQVILLHSKC